MATPTFKTWLDDEDLLVQLEEHKETESAVFLHVHVKTGRWNLSLAYRCYTLLDKLITQLAEKGKRHIFTYNAAQDDKWRKFLKMYGFKKAFEEQGLDVYVRKI